jgi:hypothetical protein
MEVIFYIVVIWVMAPCSLEIGYRRFGRTFYLQPHGSSLKTEAAVSFETLVTTYKTARVTTQTATLYLASYKSWRSKHPHFACTSFLGTSRNYWPPLWSSGQSFWVQIQRSRVWFLALPGFLRSRGSRTGSTQPREDNWGATWMKK